MYPLDSVRGPALIGLGLSLSLYGVLIAQMSLSWRTYALASDKKDKIRIRYLMLYLFGLETVMVFYDIEATASRLFSPTPAPNTPEDSTNPLLSTNAILTVLLSTPVQMFLSWKIFALSRGKLIAASIIALAGTSLVSGMMTATRRLAGRVSVLFRPFEYSDGGLAIIFRSRRHPHHCLPRGLSRFASTDRLIARTIRLEIQSGMTTTACAVAEGILVLEQKMASYLIPELILSKLYVNSLFATLNAMEKRNGLLRDDRPTGFLQFNNSGNHNGLEQTSRIGYRSSETLEAGISSVESIREDTRDPASGVALNPVVQRL
ncbi:hypothetical protein BDN71DRAFT_1508308 [Pleurotus eryngii]|uniref:DUF6534 domain-containing protein n=1 Tax=Pleurotus eryngii TaxID=5323 RepID=A0A9P5ZUD1_PLEER|nr:hypothetical protein BDN71DRAFT_1508308 [Pleurotus eryngii]